MSEIVAEREHHHAHHFNSAEDEYNSAKQGMWIFLVTEVLFLGGIFTAYGVLRGLYPEMFAEAYKQLSVTMGGVNTIFLICSSLTMVLAVGAAQRNQRKHSIWFLIVTLLFAGAFLVVKYFEYSHKFHVGLLPAGYFTNTEVTHPKAPLFFSLYFTLTGLHGIHVLLGMGAITWILGRTIRGDFHSNYYTPVEVVGLYWHFVDLFWIYLFPLLYLVG